MLFQKALQCFYKHLSKNLRRKAEDRYRIGSTDVKCKNFSYNTVDISAKHTILNLQEEPRASYADATDNWSHAQPQPAASVVVSQQMAPITGLGITFAYEDALHPLGNWQHYGHFTRNVTLRCSATEWCMQ